MITLRHPSAGTMRTGAIPRLDGAELLVAYPVQRLYVLPAQVRSPSFLPREALSSRGFSALPVSVLPFTPVVVPPSLIPPIARFGIVAIMAAVWGVMVISHG